MYSQKFENHLKKPSKISAWNSKQPVFLWLFQLDDSQSLHKKWLFHQTPIKKLVFRVSGANEAKKWAETVGGV